MGSDVANFLSGDGDLLAGDAHRQKNLLLCPFAATVFRDPMRCVAAEEDDEGE